MISREPTIERLAIARALLLEPFGLTEAMLSRALRTIAAHRIDDADLYFQYTRSEGWGLEACKHATVCAYELRKSTAPSAKLRRRSANRCLDG